MQTWVQTVCKTGVFIICSQVLIHCRPDSSYEKYLKMLVSIMILIQLLVPVNQIIARVGKETDNLGNELQWVQERFAGEKAAEETDKISVDAESDREKEIKRVRVAPVRWEAEDHAGE